jgi:tRNA uridine 5-carboxymethylaminomethyl modification enzyme
LLGGEEVADIDLERLEVRIKYDGYLQRQERELEELRRLQSQSLRPEFWINGLDGVSRETAEKISSHRPKTVFELSRISGVTPAAVLKIARDYGGRASTETQGA